VLLAVTTAAGESEAMWVTALALFNAGHRDVVDLVASLLVVRTDGLVLLAHHHHYGQWGLLGGYVESGDTSLSAATTRELLEDTAIEAHVHPALIDVHMAAFAPGTAPDVVANDELTGLEWFAVRDLPAPLTPVAAELVGHATATTTFRP
jgi:8-oxo-dGTP pyrophosphatase MutT (NUDIX family)